ncbi:SDR family NAD(P)-dependent oxidoreductase [Bradyrhizobium jicamae]|nr:SDR family NAD(P)-dependent oxidoreductase [Bradyrhizobium jicamae]
MNVNGQTILITGSTDGVGRYVAKKLAIAGARVLIHGRDAARAQTLADEIARAGGRAPKFYTADLSSLGEVRKLADAVLLRLGGPLLELIDRLASAELRSRQGQIEKLLHEALTRRGAWPPKVLTEETAEDETPETR